jgi:hypothetical protein
MRAAPALLLLASGVLRSLGLAYEFEFMFDGRQQSIHFDVSHDLYFRAASELSKLSPFATPSQALQLYGTMRAMLPRNASEHSLNTARTLFGMHAEADRSAGIRGLTSHEVKVITSKPTCMEVLQDTALFTGLAEDELLRRLTRHEHHHYAAEHAFLNPTTATEMTWHYVSSTAWLFSNAMHCADVAVLNLTEKDEPVLDFGGGAGNNQLYLASRGIRSTYFGVGVLEAEFVRFRLERRGWSHLVDFIKPRNPQTRWRIDPNQAIPTDSRYQVSSSKSSLL